MIILTIIGALVLIALGGFGLHYLFLRLAYLTQAKAKLELAQENLDKLTKRTEDNNGQQH